MFDRNLFSSRVKLLIDKKNIKQIELAEAVGVSKSQITDIIHMRRATSIEVLCKMADYFQVSIDYLCGLTDDPKRYYFK